MEDNYILDIIAKSCREVDELTNQDVCNDCWNSNLKEREFNIQRISQFIEFELSTAERVMYDAGEADFYLDEENPGMAGFYEKLDEALKHINAVRKFAEIKRYLEARNYGIAERFPDGSD